MTDIFDKEAYYYNLFHKDKNYKKQAKEIQEMYPDAKSILEIGCGTGLLSIELEKLGFNVYGVEPSLGMLNFYKGKIAERTTIQKIKIPEKKFDLAVCAYDVLNYIPHEEYNLVIRKLNRMANNIYKEIWNPKEKVYPFTFKKYKKCWRIRLGFKWKKIAHLLYIFGGKGIVVNYHKLYLHE